MIRKAEPLWIYGVTTVIKEALTHEGRAQYQGPPRESGHCHQPNLPKHRVAWKWDLSKCTKKGSDKWPLEHLVSEDGWGVGRGDWVSEVVGG